MNIDKSEGTADADRRSGKKSKLVQPGWIKVRGARQHNLKNVDLDLPKNKLIVFTGLSGSGKSSMAFDTIYAEGQRRYVESLSSYARQFLGVMGKPDVDSIEGLSPAIAIDQKSVSHNPRSTVGTITEIYDYMRLLWARVGHPHCPVCGREIAQQSVSQITSQVIERFRERFKEEKMVRVIILSPVVRERKGSFTELFSRLRSKGFTKARVDGQVKDLTRGLILIKTNKHTIEAVVDRVSLEKSQMKDEVAWANLRTRLADSLEQAVRLSDGLVIVAEVKDQGFEFPENPKEVADHLYSEKFACPEDNISLAELEPRMFSFNSPAGACETCSGIGSLLKLDRELILKPNLSVLEGGILPFSQMFEHDTWWSRLVAEAAKVNGVILGVPIGSLPKEKLEVLLEGTGGRKYRVSGENKQGKLTGFESEFVGLIPELERRHSQTDSDWVRGEIEKYMRKEVCQACGGARLRPESLGVTIDGESIAQACSWSINELKDWLVGVRDKEGILSEREGEIAGPILREIDSRLGFLVAVGLSYLTLDRAAATLAGGEAQRIRLASQIGTGLTGILYVLDEPSIGLHPRDNRQLITSLERLRDLGNTVVVVEHDREMMEAADVIVDFGPGAGEEGGRVVATGDPEEIRENSESLTGRYLAGKREVEVAEGKKKLIGKEAARWLVVKGAKEHNLKDLTVKFPLGRMVVVTGVSGSGKSTLVVETLYQVLAGLLNAGHREKPGEMTGLEGADLVDRVGLIDQSPIGRTPRSNPATYTGVMTPIRDLYAQLPEARVRGYKPGRFSFNVKGGRCEACEGQGEVKIEMQFLADMYVTCDICHGSRYNGETLEVHYRGKSVAEVLGMTVGEAREFFHAVPQIANKLETLKEVGLGYIKLGQPAPTLSGGEAQRVKLASELGKRATGRTVYILDEPTTGLHFADLEKLLKVLRELVNKGNTVVVIEHNLDVIKSGDWIIDLGPEGGEEGGQIVAEGSPGEVMKVTGSYTGEWLRKGLS
jgi:excinuclease ABC subunit A